FFKEEDGIRSFHVTGVQTCALPLYGGEHPPDPGDGPAAPAAPLLPGRLGRSPDHRAGGHVPGAAGGGSDLLQSGPAFGLGAPDRSEERRVGTERGRRGWTASEQYNT